MPQISNLSTLPFFSSSTYQRFIFQSLQSKCISSSSSPVPSQQHISHLILDQKSFSQALETFKWASKLPNFTHSQSTYRALIHKLCGFRRFDIVQELLHEMPNTIGVPPDEDIFITIVRGLGRAHMAKRVIKVVDLVTQFGKKPSLKIFNSILDVLVKEDIDLARNFYRKKMMGSEENLVQALVLLEKCFNLGFVPDVVTVTKVLEVLCNVGRVTEAVDILERLESKGSVVDVVAHNTLIKGFCRLGKVKSWASLFEGDGERKGCLPNVDTYNILISGCCESEMLDLALDLFNEMKTDGINWNFVTYDTLIKRFVCSGGRVEDGFKILEIMEDSKEGSGGRLSPYDSVLYGLCIRRISWMKHSHF
uniref:Pentacotripeptide-repeat region of PRORP domain-containing protein n=1 Tax=Fagus sylvatica TaxID=28930 RepID=A0A2N9FNU2_FAGSY